MPKSLERVGLIRWDPEHGAMIDGEFTNALFRDFAGLRVRLTIVEEIDGEKPPTAFKRGVQRPRLRQPD